MIKVNRDRLLSDLRELAGIGRFKTGVDRVALSPLEASIAHALTERFGAVVGREALSRRAWPSGAPTRNALDVQMVRFRRRVEPLGLEVRTVRSRGYLLQGAGIRMSTG